MTLMRLIFADILYRFSAPIRRCPSHPSSIPILRHGTPMRTGKFIGACAVLIAFAATFSAQTRPNIIFIQADDLGYGDLSCYGQWKFKTLNIDCLAAEGMRFTQYY